MATRKTTTARKAASAEKYPRGKGAATTRPKKPLAERTGAKFMTLEECADELAITKSLVITLIQKGDLKCSYISKQRRIHVDDLAKYVDKVRGIQAA